MSQQPKKTCANCGQPGPAAATACLLCGTPFAAEEQRWRIPCPNGHVFKVAESWIGRGMVCPTCNEPFVPQVADSLEQRDEHQRQQQEAEADFARRWLIRAIWAAAVCGLLLAALVVMSVVR